MTEQIKQFFATNIESTKTSYIGDLEVMTEEQLASKPGQAGRCAFDFTYEVALINRRFACRIRGEAPPALPAGGLIQSPDDYRSKAAAIEDIRSSFEEVAAAWAALPDDQIFREIVLESGEKSSPFDYAYMCCYHGAYHDAQLNLLQAMNGDQEVHWG